ncbi:unnamed protein product [Bursaphelenchus xylophilus]|uniref:(pine wood nematode) hypothetical protein n=1 Tax=Bursaphelenchus xylophilus TaxID=6326 RepID=A0A1I7RP26_BURXY|nr:unnamed protein product [Bursaphelenchus xylophilus]CAG9124481.1 unnamed protein product [Bursaphelenchus xylophilus]
MLNISCHITDPSGVTRRYTVKTEENSSVQQLLDRIQSRFPQTLTRIQRNDRINNEPAHILFFDEPVEPGDEFFFGFEPEETQCLQKASPTTSTPPPQPTANESSFREKLSPVINMPILLEEPISNSTQPIYMTSSFPESSTLTPPSQTSAAIVPIAPFQAEQYSETPTHLTSSLATMTVEKVLQGCRKAEVIYEKLKRAESILPAERQLLVRTAGRWLMDCCATRMKPTSAERAFFAREFFGKLPNFQYEIKDFHNSQSRGFLDVFIYNERDRKSRAGELNRPFIPSDALVKSLKRKFSKVSDGQGNKIEDLGIGPFPTELTVPTDTITSLSYLEEDPAAFELRFAEVIIRDFPNQVAERLAERWEFEIAPKIVKYVKKVNFEFYNKASEGIADKEGQHGLIALKLIPFLVRRVYKDHSKLSYIIVCLKELDDAVMLNSMRERHDAGPVIFTDNNQYRIVVMDKMIRCEQSAALALEKLLKAYYVYSLPLSSMRKTLFLFILTFFQISPKATSAFKETVKCIMTTS